MSNDRQNRLQALQAEMHLCNDLMECYLGENGELPSDEAEEMYFKLQQIYNESLAEYTKIRREGFSHTVQIFANTNESEVEEDFSKWLMVLALVISLAVTALFVVMAVNVS